MIYRRNEVTEAFYAIAVAFAVVAILLLMTRGV
jgi:hypothetical protein